MSSVSVKSGVSGTGGRKEKEPLEVKDLRVIVKEKVIVARIGIENDNYLQYAIKNKAWEAVLYLLREVSEFDLLY